MKTIKIGFIIVLCILCATGWYRAWQTEILVTRAIDLARNSTERYLNCVDDYSLLKDLYIESLRPESNFTRESYDSENYSDI